MALFEKKSVFRKFIDSITMAVYDNPELGPEFLEQLEESLVMADVGIETSDKIIDALNKAINYEHITREREIKRELSRILEELMDKGERNLMTDEFPLIILMIGINGGGKTTTIAKLAHMYKKQGKNLYDALIDIYKSYGFYEQCLETVKLVGEAGKNKIEELMKYFRDDFKSDMVKQKIDYLNDATGLPKANVLKFIVSNGWFAVRPSGTEPKIKFYFETYSDSQQAAKEIMAFLKENVMQHIE